MTQYILLIQDNALVEPSPDEWAKFISKAMQSGLFKGGSEIGARMLIGAPSSAASTAHIVGYMRFDSDDRQKIVDLLQDHPVVRNGGSVELCEMPKS